MTLNKDVHVHVSISTHEWAWMVANDQSNEWYFIAKVCSLLSQKKSGNLLLVLFLFSLMFTLQSDTFFYATVQAKNMRAHVFILLKILLAINESLCLSIIF